MSVAPGRWFDGEGGEGGLVAVSCVHPPVLFEKKNSKINRIEIRIYFHAENKSVGKDLFLDTK